MNHRMSESLTYQTIKTANQVREAEELKIENRKKKLLVLILEWMNVEGYAETARTFAKEINFDLKRHDVCDNIDLDTILQEYEAYYYIRFNKYPKIIKKVTATSIPNGASKNNSVTRKSVSTIPILPKMNGISTLDLSNNSIINRPTSVENGTAHNNNSNNTNNKRDPKYLSASQVGLDGGVSTKNKKNSDKKDSQDNDEFGLSVTKIDNNNEKRNSYANVNSSGQVAAKKKMGQIIDFRAMLNEATKLNIDDNGGSGGGGGGGAGGGAGNPSDKLMKPLAGYIGYNSEWRDLAQVISRDIYMHNPNVKWDDIIGLDAAKRTIKEAVVYPIKYPQLFTGILSPWKGLLLYGPPGTGKTLLAKAVATECNTTFFNISASSIVSKWRGDSEKLVRVLFEMARFYAPATIFIDELESIMSIRGSSSGGGEHEGSRRMKTELLVQMDGLAKSEDLVFLLAASNIPWELDHAMLRRLEKRIIVDLPTYEARIKMFKHHLPPVVIHEKNGLVLGSDLDYEKLAELTDGYSGSDIKLVCKEAAMRCVRKVFAVLENLEDGDDVGNLHLDEIKTQDVVRVLESTKPSARQFVKKYEAWTKEYESV